MKSRPDVVAIAVFIVFFALVTVLGFIAARWRRGDLNVIHEWGLAGRRFGTVVTWFLMGGDLYTAYTMIAVPALVYGSGAVGFFALPYTIVAYPFFYLTMPRLWNVSKRHAFVTTADFVQGRYGNRLLALAIAVTGIIATLPYIALQLVGIQVVISAMGIGGSGIGADAPLIIAFVILAAYTYTSGLRAPALIAFVKDLMIYITVIVAVIAIPWKLGGFAHIFAAAQNAFAARVPPAAPGSVILGPAGYWAFSTLALGSAFALFLYPHSVTGTLASARGDVLRRNAVFLPAYSLVLGLIALLGYMAIAAGVKVKSPNSAVPALFNAMFPSWFIGFAFAAIAIAALVPAAIMSIAAANLWTRNIYKAFLRPDASDAQEARIAKITSLVVKVGALAFIIFLPTQYAINLQLLGGIWILQTFPAIILGLYTRWFHHHALLWGWLVAMILGSSLFLLQGLKPTAPLVIGSFSAVVYIAVEAVIVNIAVAALLTVVLDRAGIRRGPDATVAEDYDDPPPVIVPTTTLGTTQPL
ncbi:MAG: sodium:solute symporter family protein [Candidatus Eremiobacteraeota bacterium]|nr:sodium:solute symporter family protein [Candidatus Eremiobacteraeota bacterium]